MLEVSIQCATYQTYKKKAHGYKNEQKIFVSFLVFCHLWLNQKLSHFEIVATKNYIKNPIF